MPRALLLLAAAALTAGTLAACTPSPVEPVEPAGTPTSDAAPTAEPDPSDADPGPTVDPATSCLDSALVATATGLAVTATGSTTPPAGPVDAALVGVPRELCTYDLDDGSRIGFSPLVLTPDTEAMDAALGPVVEHDDCTLVSGYLVTGQDTYYVWTGGSFAAAYIVTGDPTDPEVWLAKIVDEVGLCQAIDDGL